MSLRRPKPRPAIDKSGLAIQHNLRRAEKPEENFRSGSHRSWIGSLPCLRCQRTKAVVMVEAAHLRKGTDGAGRIKPSDFWCWPGCIDCHEGFQHVVGEVTFWRDHIREPDPHRFVLETFGLKSTCGATRDAAQQEWEKRYAG